MFSIICLREDGHLLTVSVMIPGTLEECVLAMQEAETYSESSLLSFNDTSNNSLTISNSILTN